MSDSKGNVTALTKKYFAGQCERCGEAYEANSRTDDLKGIKFKCRKTRCSGDVILEQGQSTPTKFHKPISIESNRFC